MLIVKDLSIERLNKKIFENINLSLSPGNITILKGKNGSGKNYIIKSNSKSNRAIIWINILERKIIEKKFI